MIMSKEEYASGPCNYDYAIASFAAAFISFLGFPWWVFVLAGFGSIFDTWRWKRKDLKAEA